MADVRNNDNKAVALHPDQVTRMLDNQSRELELRAQELILRKEQEKHNFEFAKEALKAQQADRAQIREQWKAGLKIRGALALGFLVIVLGFCAWAIRYDKDQLVMEIGKACLFFGAGGASSYSFGKYRGKLEQQSIDQNRNDSE